MCKGDPHCFKFDTPKYDQDQELYVSGSCMYTMVRDDCMPDGGHPTFEIIANFERVNLETPKSFVKEVIINLYTSPFSVSESRLSYCLNVYLFKKCIRTLFGEKGGKG